MHDKPSQTFLQQFTQAPLWVKISAVATLALGGAIAKSIRDNGTTTLGYTGTLFAAALPCIVALFAVALMFKMPWRHGITLAVAMVVASFSFEEFPKLFEPRLGPGFLSHLVGGVAALLVAAISAVVLSKALGTRNK